MKLKMICVLSVVLLAVVTLNAAFAADCNASDETVAMENTQDSDAISLEKANDEQIIEKESDWNVSSDAQSKDLLGNSIESEDKLAVAAAGPAISKAPAKHVKLNAAKKQPAKLKSNYIKFKGKSKYTWIIKKSNWNRMKIQAIKQYKFFRSHGSYHPGYSSSVKVIAIKAGHKYRGIAFAVRNYRGMRCEVRGLPGGLRASTTGDY